MKIRVEIDPSMEEEIIIHAPAVSDRILILQRVLEQTVSRRSEIAVKDGEKECFIPAREILFAEVTNDVLWVHTQKDCYRSKMHLQEAQELLPYTFVRASKSCLINTARVTALTRTVTGTGEAAFAGTGKRAFISRKYYNDIRKTIEETRLIK